MLKVLNYFKINQTLLFLLKQEKGKHIFIRLMFPIFFFQIFKILFVQVSLILIFRVSAILQWRVKTSSCVLNNKQPTYHKYKYNKLRYGNVVSLYFM